jgi:hypothetical protein
MPRSKDFIRVFVNIMSFFTFAGICRVDSDMRPHFLLIVCMRACGYSHNAS